jgi:hypothetical protein
MGFDEYININIDWSKTGTRHLKNIPYNFLSAESLAR